jgi:fluoride ion exporter CrcB/FEX
VDRDSGGRRARVDGASWGEVLVHGRWPMMRFPLATLIVNGAGCLISGLLAGLIMPNRLPRRLYWREFVVVGVLAGCTTFSTFGARYRTCHYLLVTCWLILVTAADASRA